MGLLDFQSTCENIFCCPFKTLQRLAFSWC